MKRYLTTFLVFCGICMVNLSYAQGFRQTVSNMQDVYEGGDENVEFVTAKGDFNHDGVSDFVVTFAKYSDASNDFAVYFGDNDAKFSLFRACETNLYRKEFKITVNDKGVIRIQCGDGDTDVFLYRWQDNDFYLIGGKTDRHKSEHFDVSYNFLTNKMIRTEGEGKDKKSTTLTMPDMPKLKLGYFPMTDYAWIGYLFESDYSNEEKEIFNIFRLMQNNEMMHWHLCDEYFMGLPSIGEDDTYSVFDDFIGGSYICFTWVGIKKESDGVFFVSIESTSGPRDIDEDSDEVEEVKSKEFFRFKNGSFIELE